MLHHASENIISQDLITFERHLWRKRQIPHNQWRKEENHYEKLTSRYKRKHFTDKLDLNKTKDIWRCIHCTRGNRKTMTPPIENSQGFAFSTEEKAKIFKEKILDVNVGNDTPLPTPEEQRGDEDPIDWVEPSNNEIEEALANYSTDTAPGESKITYTILRWLHQADPMVLPNLFKSILATGHQPRCLKTANVVIIPKPNNPAIR